MNKKERQKLVWWIVVIVLVLLVSFFAYTQVNRRGVFLGPGSSVTRSFSRADPYTNENVVVTLDVTLEAGDQVYSIEETLPSGFVMVDGGDGTVVGNKIRWVEQPPLGIKKTYTVKFDSSGTYVFDGDYMFNDEAPVKTILGDTDVVVTTCSSSTEVCDGVDNDCNHLIDEGSVCNECNSDKDCGTDGWVGSPVCQTNDVYQDYRTFTCNNPAAADSTCSDATVPQIKEDCVFNEQCQGDTTCTCVVDYLEDTDATCCVAPGEIVTYVTDWLNGAGPTTQSQVTTAATKWVSGVSACPA